MPPEQGYKLEQAAKTWVPGLWPTSPLIYRHILFPSVFGGHALQCKQFLRHKTWMLSPTFLKNNTVPIHKVRRGQQGESSLTP